MKIRGRDLDFTRWAMRRGTRRWGLNSRLFATDPWPVIRRSIHDSGIPKPRQEEAIAYLGQARAFFHGAADAALAEAQPVLLYYSFLNLAKALILVRGLAATLTKAEHGLSEGMGPGGRELVDAFLDAHPATATRINVFDLFWRALGGVGVGPAKAKYELPTVLPQIVPGHRLWAAGARRNERFVALDQVQLLEDGGAIWTKLHLQHGDLTRFGIATKNVLKDAGLAGAWKQVTAPTATVCLEPSAPTTFTSRAADKVMDAINTIAPHLWTTVRSDKPYRTYYLYMCPAAQVGSRMPQLCSIYAIAYYLGSITRYRPHHFTSIIDGAFGPFVEAFLNDQPTQFLYLLASEFTQREVTRAALA
ncbi:MAG: YaaC family protein [Vicinamibacterales bacterium]